jgi:hypothetical protein
MGKGIVKLGEGNWAVKDGNLLAAKETNGRFKNAEFTVTRGSDATYVGRDGLIANETGDDTPRIDFTDNTDGHLLLEPQSTNLVTYSEDFTQWTKSNASVINVIATTVISPNGVSFANKLYPIGTGSSSYIYQNAAAECFSIFVKKGERRWFLIYGGFANSNVWFDSENGVLGTVRAEATATVESFSNDWYRIKIIWTQNSTQVRIYNTDDDNTLVSTANNTDGLYIWGAQAEALPYPTSYIPTNGGQVTRDAEIVQRESIDEIDIPQEEGTIYLELKEYKQNTEIFNFDRSTSNSIHVGTDSNGVLKVWGYYEPSGTGTSVQVTLSANTSKVAIAFKNGSFIVYADGEEELNTSTFVWTPTDSIDRLYFNRGGYVASQGLSKVKALRIYKEAFNTTQLDELTS